jgi:hypothetical protein
MDCRYDGLLRAERVDNALVPEDNFRRKTGKQVLEYLTEIMVQNVPPGYLAEIVLDHYTSTFFVDQFPCLSEKLINGHVPTAQQEYEQPEFWTEEL